MQKTPARWLLPTLSVVALITCGPSLDHEVEKLASGGGSDGTRQMVLLAKGRAVDPLLRALDGTQTTEAGRVALVEVLASLSMRVDDERINDALFRCLREDRPTVRAAASRHLGRYRVKGAVAPLIRALDDGDALVRLAAAIALGLLEDRHTVEHQAQIAERMRQLATDPNPDLRTVALIRVETRVHEYVEEARKNILSGGLARAESTLIAALDYFPESKRARYRLGRFFVDEVDPPRGIDMLRAHGMLIDVPLLSLPPTIDGQVSPDEWSAAAVIDTFYALNTQHPAPMPTTVRTRARVGATHEGLYVAWTCFDSDPSAIVTRTKKRDEQFDRSYVEDRVEFFLDHKFSHARPFRHIAINSVGALVDVEFSAHSGTGNAEWDADVESAIWIGDDRWSVELLLRFGSDIPTPAAGDLWGANFVRSYRGSEYVQWVRTYPNGLQPDDFGVLRFPRDL